MKIFDAPVSLPVAEYLVAELPKHQGHQTANQAIQEICGVVAWFSSSEEFSQVQEKLLDPDSGVEKDRTEYGDFQTNEALARRVVSLLAEQGVEPHVVVEPTCGKGAFLLAALEAFPTVRRVFGVEIYRPYVWEAKFRILHYFLHHPQAPKPEIRIVHDDVFAFPFLHLQPMHADERLLVLGNPPWVTNAHLGSLNSSNLPPKSNFKQFSGLDALTGKGNFDLGEYITLMLLDAFKTWQGDLALLVKSAVVRNLVHGLRKHPRRLSRLKSYRIDAKKEFGAAVEAALLVGRLGGDTAVECEEFDLQRPQQPLNRFGWVGERFAAQVGAYARLKAFDGASPFEWRQGIKHDCSSVMELEKTASGYRNALGETIELEPDFVYPPLKSSDLKCEVVDAFRKFVIVPQQKVGQDTRYIQDHSPLTFRYLKRHEQLFAARKSSIYRGKPAFSIFGVGDYSFKPYKVALSGLYKSVNFALLSPAGGRPVMLDDTCYFLGFDDHTQAVCTWLILNHDLTRQLLAALSFPDAKRPYTKDLLMRIDLRAIGQQIAFSEVSEKARGWALSREEWEAFIGVAKVVSQPQLALFA